jgi:PAS domain S-box-containing protein
MVSWQISMRNTGSLNCPPATESRRHDDARQTSDRIGFVLLDNSEFGMIVVNENRLISIWNSWMENASGYSRHQALGRKIEDVFPVMKESKIVKSLENVFQNELPIVLSPKLNKVPFPLMRRANQQADPQQIDQHITIKPITDDNGDSFCFIQISDVSSSTKREALLRQATRESREVRDEIEKVNKDKDRLFSIIAHDLKSPFTGLLGISDLLSRRGAELTHKEIIEYGDGLNRSARRVYQLLENLLDWSMIQMGSMAFTPVPLDPKLLLAECVDLLSTAADTKNISLVVNVDDSALVIADARLTATILRNIVSNAIKFTESGGTITLSLKRLSNFCEIEIKDNGVGMSKEQVTQLLSSYGGETTFGTKGEVGTGLGIQLSKDLIAKQSGKFSVESKRGEGSSIRFTLPVF